VPAPASAAPAPPSAASGAPVATGASPAASRPPPIDPVCVGVPEWVAATETRLDELAALSEEADRLAAVFDLPGYVEAIRVFMAATHAAAADQASEAIPEPAVEANEQALATYAALVEAASLFLYYYTVEMAYETFVRATSTYEQASRMVADLRRETSRLTATCEGP
jgi:hypothetical protein